MCPNPDPTSALSCCHITEQIKLSKCISISFLRSQWELCVHAEPQNLFWEWILFLLRWPALKLNSALFYILLPAGETRTVFWMLLLSNHLCMYADFLMGLPLYINLSLSCFHFTILSTCTDKNITMNGENSVSGFKVALKSISICTLFNCNSLKSF